MTLVDKIRTLARQRDMSLPQLEQELGLGNGTISRWRNSSPNTEKLQKRPLFDQHIGAVERFSGAGIGVAPER